MRQRDDSLRMVKGPLHGLKMLLLPLCAMLLVALGCSGAGLFNPQAPTPVPTRTPAPTFTATPDSIPGVIVITPPSNGTPGVIVLEPGVDVGAMLPPTATRTPTPSSTPTATPLPTNTLEPTNTVPPDATATATVLTPTLTVTPTGTPTTTPLPTPTWTPTQTPLPTATPTAFIQVQTGLVGLHDGPGVQYPLVAQLGPNIPIAITGQTEDGEWLQICCVSGRTLWAAANEVIVNNDVTAVALVTNSQPPPTPTPTFTPTATGTPTETPTATPFPFGILQQGPEFVPTSNEYLTIWVQLSIGTATGDAAAGYFLRAQFEGVDRIQTNEIRPSSDTFEDNRNPGEGGLKKYNLKYEYRPQDLSNEGGPNQLQAIGRGTWTMWIVDGAGNQLSAKVTFTTAPSNPNREIWIHWVRTS